MTGATIINAGVRGAYGSSSNSNSFKSQITSNNTNISKASKIFINFGVNDFSNSVEVGNLSDSNSFYYGIYNGILQISDLNKNADIILIIPTVGKGYLTKNPWINSSGFKFDNYIDALIDIGTKLNIKMVDFSHVGFTSENATIYYPGGYNHLTQDGYTLLGQHLARSYESNILIYNNNKANKNVNILPMMVFDNPVELTGSKNSFYNGIYYNLNGTDTTGLKSTKQFDIQKGFNYHFEFTSYHKNNANDRKIEYTIKFINATKSSILYTFKRTAIGAYNKINIDFYSNLDGGNYILQIIGSGDNAYLTGFYMSSDSFSYDRKVRTGVVNITSTNTLSIVRNKFINGMFIFNVVVTADNSIVNLARVNLNNKTTNSDNYLPKESYHFIGIDWTSKTPVLMSWEYDSTTNGTYLLKLATGNAENGHKYIANDILYLGRNDAITEIISQEY